MAESSTFARLGTAIRRSIDAIAPSAETLARREALAFRNAYCGLLLEVARLASPHADLKQAAVAQVMKETFPMEEAELALLISSKDSGQGYTSYYEPIAIISRNCSPTQRVQFVEQLWRVANADGEIDMYEDQLVRKLAELLYVAHADFILAKHRVKDASALNLATQGAKATR